jgi:ribosomal protein S18 acetylase RimI-like enzyme
MGAVGIFEVLEAKRQLPGHLMRIELVTPTQHESLIDLLCELHTYYNDGSVASRELVRQHLFENLLGAGSPHRLVVAIEGGGTVVGLAAITLVYSLVDFAPDKRKQCHLKELYVRPLARSQGVGKALMSWVARHALENGCCRMDWPVKASNARGIAFYEGLGAVQLAERLSYRLAGLALSQLAHESGNESRGG